MYFLVNTIQVEHTQTISLNTLISLLAIIVTIGVAMVMASVWIAYRVGKLESRANNIENRQVENNISMMNAVTQARNELRDDIEAMNKRLEVITTRLWSDMTDKAG